MNQGCHSLETIILILWSQLKVYINGDKCLQNQLQFYSKNVIQGDIGYTRNDTMAPSVILMFFFSCLVFFRFGLCRYVMSTISSGSVYLLFLLLSLLLSHNLTEVFLWRDMLYDPKRKLQQIKPIDRFRFIFAVF